MTDLDLSLCNFLILRIGYRSIKDTQKSSCLHTYHVLILQQPCKIYIFHNRKILLLKLERLIYSDSLKNYKKLKEKHNLNLQSKCQIDSLSFDCPIQLNKINKFKTVCDN